MKQLIGKQTEKFKELDNFDKKILYELYNDGRISLKKVAKRIGKSESFVHYRLEKMKKTGVFQGTILILDSSLMGFHTYALYLQVMIQSKVDDVVNYLKEQPETWALSKMVGEYQLYGVLYVNNPDELRNLIISLGEKFNGVITGYKLLMMYNSYTPAPNYLFNEIDYVNHDKLRFASTEIKLSQKEKKFLKVLSKNPRASFTKIAKEMRSTRPVVSKLYKNLVKKNVILYIRPYIDAKKLGYTHKHITIKLKFSGMNRLREITSYLISLSSSSGVTLTFGSYDITGKFTFKSLEEFQKFQKDLFALFGDCISSMIHDDYYETIKFEPHKELQIQ